MPGVASGGFEWEKPATQAHPTVCPIESSILSRRHTREFGSRFDLDRFVGQRTSGARSDRLDRLAQSRSENASHSLCPVVDMVVEDSDGVEAPHVQDMSPEMLVLGNRFAALACKCNAHVDAVATQPAPVPLATWVDGESQREHPRLRLLPSTRILLKTN